jgi:hypothetical protein
MTNIVLVDDAQARISAGPRSPKSTSVAPLSEAATSCWKRMRRASLRKRLGSIAPQSLHNKPDGQSVGRGAGRSEAMLKGRRPLESRALMCGLDPATGVPRRRA